MLRAETSLLLGASVVSAAFLHPGMLHTAADFTRVKAMRRANAEPWVTGWNKLAANAHAQPGYAIQGPVAELIRGTDSGLPENYQKLYNDAAAAYQCGLHYQISGDTGCADKAVQILDAWGSTLTSISGGSDKFLASGIYGYELANAAELVRGYSGWSAANFTQFKNMMLNVFYPMNVDFLDNHNGVTPTHYWANWDLCNMASALSIAILTDDQTKFNAAISRFTTTTGEGQIGHAIWHIFEEEGSGKRLGQCEESGRDQGHATLDFSLLGAYAQMAYNQGQDLFAYNNSQILAGAEYTAKYNLGFDVPYVPFVTPEYNQPVISNNSRGNIRPEWELLYAHYSSLKGLNASWTGMMRDLVNDQSGGAEGGGGDYGSTSGGYDQLGFGTLMYRLEA